MKILCETCKVETEHTIETKQEPWMNEDIQDEDLSDSQMIARMNRDNITITTCTECFSEVEEM